MRRDNDFLLGQLFVLDFRIEANDIEAVFVDFEEMVAQTHVDRGRLDLPVFERIDAQFAAGEHCLQGGVGKNHRGPSASPYRRRSRLPGLVPTRR